MKRTEPLKVCPGLFQADVVGYNLDNPGPLPDFSNLLIRDHHGLILRSAGIPAPLERCRHLEQVRNATPSCDYLLSGLKERGCRPGAVDIPLDLFRYRLAGTHIKSDTDGKCSFEKTQNHSASPVHTAKQDYLEHHRKNMTEKEEKKPDQQEDEDEGEDFARIVRQMNDVATGLGKIKMVFDGSPAAYQKSGKGAYLTDKTLGEPLDDKSCQNQPDKNVYQIHQPPDIIPGTELQSK